MSWHIRVTTHMFGCVMAPNDTQHTAWHGRVVVLEQVNDVPEMPGDSSSLEPASVANAAA